MKFHTDTYHHVRINTTTCSCMITYRRTEADTYRHTGIRTCKKYRCTGSTDMRTRRHHEAQGLHSYRHAGIQTYRHTHLHTYLPLSPDPTLPPPHHTHPSLHHTHLITSPPHPTPTTRPPTYLHPSIHADRQTERQTDGQTDRHAYPCTYIHACIHTYTHTCMCSDSQQPGLLHSLIRCLSTHGMADQGDGKTAFHTSWEF